MSEVKVIVKSIQLQLEYYPPRAGTERGVFSGGVVPPSHTDELAIWANPRQVYDAERDAFENVEGSQIEITGTRRALYELGRYLIALSDHETDDPDYHDHIEDLAQVTDEPACELIIRGPRQPALSEDESHPEEPR